METEKERLARLEERMKELGGNGQPGRVGRIESRVESIEAKLDSMRVQQSRYIGIAVGIIALLQFLGANGWLRLPSASAHAPAQTARVQ